MLIINDFKIIFKFFIFITISGGFLFLFYYFALLSILKNIAVQTNATDIELTQSRIKIKTDSLF